MTMATELVFDRCRLILICLLNLDIEPRDSSKRSPTFHALMMFLSTYPADNPWTIWRLALRQSSPYSICSSTLLMSLSPGSLLDCFRLSLFRSLARLLRQQLGSLLLRLG